MPSCPLWMQTASDTHLFAHSVRLSVIWLLRMVVRYLRAIGAPALATECIDYCARHFRMFDVIPFTQLRWPVINGCVESWMQTNGRRIGTRDTHAFVIRVTIQMWYVWRWVAAAECARAFGLLKLEQTHHNSVCTHSVHCYVFSKWTHFNQDFLSPHNFHSLSHSPVTSFVRSFFTFLFSYVLIWPLKGSRTYSIYFIFRLNKKLTGNKREIWEKNWKGNGKIFQLHSRSTFIFSLQMCAMAIVQRHGIVCVRVRANSITNSSIRHQKLAAARKQLKAKALDCGSLVSAYRHTTPHQSQTALCTRTQSTRNAGVASRNLIFNYCHVFVSSGARARSAFPHTRTHTLIWFPAPFERCGV